MPCLRLPWASQPPSAARRLPMAAEAGIGVSAPYFLHRSLKLKALECAVLHTWVYLSCHPWAWISGDGAELWRRWSTLLSRVWQNPSLGAPISVNLSAATLFLPCLYVSTFSPVAAFSFQCAHYPSSNIDANPSVSSAMAHSYRQSREKLLLSQELYTSIVKI